MRLAVPEGLSSNVERRTSNVQLRLFYQSMFADTVMQLERAYLERLMLWGAASIVAGTAVLAALAVWRARSAMLSYFAWQTILWGVGSLVVGAVRWHAIPVRDLASATQLDRFLWFDAGLAAGIVALGIVLSATALKLGPRQGLLGAALAVIVQGTALFAIHARLMVALQV